MNDTELGLQTFGVSHVLDLLESRTEEYKLEGNGPVERAGYCICLGLDGI